ncbi:MAG: iron-containing alcohol dehydrogenase [Polyangiaceae bacterium]|nr:iron-containing alcohol dehydrogenase [Polyangiaceae bacterium]
MDIASNFELQPTPRVVFGPGSRHKLGRRARALGVERALLVSDPGISAVGMVDELAAVLEAEGVALEIFAEVEPNPRVQTVDRGAERLRELHDGWVIALGGGSVLDAAKAIALLGNNAGTIADHRLGVGRPAPGRRSIAIATTAGTGSETNAFAVVTDPAQGRKVLIGHPSLLPSLVLLDPELTRGVPRIVTATTGMDALVHALEALTSSRRNPASQALALRAIALVSAHLRAVVSDGTNGPAREAMLIASHLAGLAFSSSGLGICHAMGHPLSARLDVAHGQALASVLPRVLDYHRETCAELLAEASDALGSAEGGSTEARVEAALGRVRSLSRDVGTDRPLRELGVSDALIPTLAEDALADPLILTTPRPATQADVEALYRQAL